jgi:hypothetical protein
MNNNKGSNFPLVPQLQYVPITNKNILINQKSENLKMAIQVTQKIQ